MWVKQGNDTFQITSFNTCESKEEPGKYELWVHKAKGGSTKLLAADKEYVMQYKQMFDYAAKSGENYVEV